MQRISRKGMNGSGVLWCSRSKCRTSAVIQVAGILTEQSQRVDAGFRQLWAEMRANREEIRSTREELSQRIDALSDHMGGVNQRLDRLIAVTMKERTAGAERLSKIEERLDKLEERGGG